MAEPAEVVAAAVDLFNDGYRAGRANGAQYVAVAAMQLGANAEELHFVSRCLIKAQELWLEVELRG